MKVAILGGGMAGVTTARTLHQRGYDIHLYEAAPRLGGLCRSDVVEGFVYDTSGGHVLHSRDQRVLGEMLATVGDSVRTERNTKIHYRDRYVKYPFENGLSDLPPEDNLACLKGYLEATMARRGGAAEPGNFRDWIHWRFGEGIARLFMYPYNEKIWCSDLKQVAVDWVSGRIPEAPLEDVLRAALGLASEGYTHQSVFYYPRKGGFETLVAAYARGFEERIRLATPVQEVETRTGAYTVNGEAFDRVINTLPLRQFMPVLRPAPLAEVLAALAALKHLSLATVFLAVDRPALSPHSWVYLPHPEDGPVNRLTFLSNYSPDNAPQGCSSVLAEVTYAGDSGRPHLEALEKEVTASFERIGILKGDELMFTRSRWNEYAYPVYDLGFKDKIGIVLRHLDQLAIPSFGRFARYSYVNTDQVVLQVEAGLRDQFPPLGR